MLVCNRPALTPLILTVIQTGRQEFISIFVRSLSCSAVPLTDRRDPQHSEHLLPRAGLVPVGRLQITFN